MIRHILTWLAKSIAVHLVLWPAIFVGPFLVAVALPFRKAYPVTRRPFLQFPGEWELVTLPNWMRWWGNEFDGALGDKRGWWDNYCRENYSKPCTAFRSMWQWLAIRNPANYLGRNVCGIDVTQYDFWKLAGDDVVEEEPGKWQWQFLVGSKQDSGVTVHRLFCVFPWWFDQAHAVMIDIGWKIALKHNLVTAESPVADRFKGTVFCISPWKAL